MRIIVNAEEREQVRASIDQQSVLDTPFVVANALAACIATFALLANSASGVIGAMLIAMMLGPISGVGLALVDADLVLLRRSGVTLLAGVSIVGACSLIIGYLHQEIPARGELLARTHPNYLDLMIAMAGGAIGAYAELSPRVSASVVGVAIATALVPPLCAGGIFVTRGEFDNAAGAYLLAFTNIVAIQFSTSVMLGLAGFRRAFHQFELKSKIFWLHALSLSLMIGLSLLLGYQSRILLADYLYQSQVSKALDQALLSFRGANLQQVRIERIKGENLTLIRALVGSPRGFSASEVGKLEGQIPPPADGSQPRLRIRHVKVTIMERSGPIYEADEILAAKAKASMPTQLP